MAKPTKEETADIKRRKKIFVEEVSKRPKRASMRLVGGVMIRARR